MRYDLLLLKLLFLLQRDILNFLLDLLR